MSVLDEIIRDATADSASTSNLLRKVMVVAHRLQAVEIRTWVQRELNGYGLPDDLPEYRKGITVNVRGHWTGMFNSSATQLVSRAGVPKEAAQDLFSVSFHQALAELEEMATMSNDLGVPWDAVDIGRHNRLIDEGKVPHLEGFYLFSAERVVPPGLLSGIINTVRNTALDLALGLQSADPEAGDTAGPTVEDSEVRQVVWNVTNNIYGHGNQVAHGDDSILTLTIETGDIAGLLRAGRKLGLDDDGETMLAEAVVTPDKERSERIRSFLQKVREGGFLVGTGLTANVVADRIDALIRMFFGQS